MLLDSRDDDHAARSWGRALALLGSLVLCWMASGTLATADDEIRLNEIQVIGSHNSYHIEPSPAVRKLIAAAGEHVAQALEYTHPPLAEQFSSRGVRQIELDLFYDPEGGLYAKPSAGAALRRLGREPGPDHDPEGLLRRPGMKVLHVPDIDYRTTALTLIDALKQVREWSKAHPRHVPIMILLELKSEVPPPLPTKPLPFDAKALKAVEAEILSVFALDKILTPDDVRGSFATLRESIQARGWPRLDTVRGKVMFALDNEDQVRDVYLEGHSALQGRLLFTSVSERHPAAAWFKINDPVVDFDRIRRLVQAGFLVRTRADVDTIAARANDTHQRDMALSSGAQFVSTDYPVADPRFTGYCVQFPGKVVARSNPASGNARGDGIDHEK